MPLPSPPLEFAQVPLAQLTVGSVLTAPIFDSSSDRRKLLGKHVEIDEAALAKLAVRGITSVSVSKRDLAAMSAGTPQGNRRVAPDYEIKPCSLQTEYSRELESEAKSVDLARDFDKPLDPKWNTPPVVAYEKEAVKEALAQREQQVDYVESLFVKMVKRDGVETEELAEVCSSSIQSVLSDKDLFLALGLNPFDSNYPSRHSLHVSSVAISIGVMLGLDDQSLHDLGTGCLIHDVGMLKLDSRLYKAKRLLKDNERALLSQHPILTLESLACPGAQLSRVSRIVAYQIHERCNGTGYPRGITSEEMHSLSKIAAVADAYVGLVSNRTHRRALMPYFAVEKILKSLPQGLYDPKVVRGLLHAVSLFPIGSFVETTEKQLARVVRSNGTDYMRPIIEIWNEKHKQFEPDLVNLAADKTVRIKRAVPALKAA